MYKHMVKQLQSRDNNKPIHQYIFIIRAGMGLHSVHDVYEKSQKYIVAI